MSLPGFRTDVKETWSTRSERTMTREELGQYQTRMEAARRARDAEERRRQAAAATTAQGIWDAAQPAPHDHSYLLRKNEDFYWFKSSAVLLNSWNSGCGDGEKTELLISGLVDFRRARNAADLTISVNSEQTIDTCHSRPALTTYCYALVR